MYGNHGPYGPPLGQRASPRGWAPARNNSNPHLPPVFTMHVNAVYYPNWRIYKQCPPSSLNLDVISHVFYAFAWVKPDGNIYLSDEWADTQIDVDGTKGCLGAFRALKQRHGFLRVILSVGGGGKGSENFPAVARDPSARARFAYSARELVSTYGLDGIDIDWEHPTDAQQGRDYLELLNQLRAFLPRPRFLLTSALPAGEWALQHIPLEEVCEILDLINLMAYDFAGPWTPHVGHHAQLWSPDDTSCSCHSASAYVLSRGVPSQKLLLGIPAYGRSFLGASRPGQTYSGHGGEEGTFEFKDLPLPGTQEAVDNNIGAAYCIGGDGGFVTYDNPETVRMKADYVRRNRMGGMFYWTGTGDATGNRSLVYNGYMGLHL